MDKDPLVRPNFQRQNKQGKLNINDFPPLPSNKDIFLRDSVPSNILQDRPRKKKAKNEPKDIIHYVTNKDTLVGLSLKYNVNKERIKQVNHLFDDTIISRKYLLIPNTLVAACSREPAVDAKKLAMQSFQKIVQKLAGQHTEQVRLWSSQSEARSYLEMNEWDLTKATSQWEQDFVWELKHPFPSSRV